jgi:hypothetical protein
MAYRDFNFSRIKEEFGVTAVYRKLFDNIKNVEASQKLKADLDSVDDMPMSTEKLISEALVFPILQEIRLNNRLMLRLFSGENLNADKKKGLNGECDFIITKDPEIIELHTPIISVVEAKKGVVDDPKSLAQLTAQMIGARVFNQKNNAYQTIHGACTSGKDWLFLKLEDDTLYIDQANYGLNNVPQLLGVLQTIINFYK